MSRLPGLAILLLVISMAVSTPFAQPSTNWAKRVDSGNGPETVTNLRFYFHDVFTGKNPTAAQIIKPLASAAASSNTFYGAVVMTDDVLTEKADPSSKVIGRAQGMYSFPSQTDLTLLMTMSYGFTDGPYKGSSISIMGRNPTMDTNRELPVLGGTGLFRMAGGYARMKTLSFDASTGNAVVYYNVTVHAPASNAKERVLSETSSSSPAKQWMVSGVIAFAAFICFTL